MVGMSVMEWITLQRQQCDFAHLAQSLPPLRPPRQDLTLAGTPILLELIAWTAGAEIAADVVVAQVLAPGRGVLLD